MKKNISVKPKETVTFNDYGNGGVTYEKEEIYKAKQVSENCFFIKHPSGAELGFLHDLEDYFDIIE